MNGPLSGIKVVEFTVAMAGPYCGMMLADYGAEVIKIERVGVGDDSRAWPPHFPPDKRIAYPLAEIRHWLKIFLQRFFAFSQFKRSAMPNGPKVAAGGALSPRGDWRAPSDGNAAAWLRELERNVPEK